MVQTLENFVVEEIEIGGVPFSAPPADRIVVKRPGLRQRSAGFRFTLGWIGLWLLMVAAGLVTRDIWPPDETRLLALAWDLWRHEAWLLPELNGRPWLSQPPLSLWLILAGWKLFALNDWWPRLLPALAGLFTLFLVSMFARRLWPDHKDIARYAPVVLLGSGLWASYQTLALKDLVVASVTLLTMIFVHGLVAYRRTGWLLLGPLTGLCLLAGGPVVLVYILPAMWLAPMWARAPARTGWGSWYAGLVLSLLLGAGIWLAWLLPASVQAGLDWQQALIASAALQPLDLFYANGSWWWYLYLVPVAFFPWSVWPLGWMRLWRAMGERIDRGFVLCLIWGVAALGLLVLLPVRQPQFLLPLAPAYVLLLAWLLMHEDLRTLGEDSFFAGMTFPVIAIGFLLALLPGLPRVEFLPAFLWQMSPLIGVAIATVGIAFSWTPTMNTGTRVMSIAVTTMFVVVAGSFAIGYQLKDRYQTPGLNKLLFEAQQDGRATAQVAPYQGEFHFNARLARPITVLTDKTIRAWILANPGGRLLTYDGKWQPNAISDAALLHETLYGDGKVRLWDAGLLIPPQ